MRVFTLQRLPVSRRGFAPVVVALLAVIVAGCASAAPTPGEDQDRNSAGTTADLGVGGPRGSGDGQSAVEIEAPEFDTQEFVAINPGPELRKLDFLEDFASQYSDYERDRLPRDAINPVYSPKFVSPAEATLKSRELVMGLEINGDARAYPVGMMRIREIVNDEVGGIPVLVTW